MEGRTQRRTSQVREASRKMLLHMLAIYAFQLITRLELTIEPQHKVPKPAKEFIFHCSIVQNTRSWRIFFTCSPLFKATWLLWLSFFSSILEHGTISDLKCSNLNRWEKFATCYQNGQITDSATDNVGTRIALTMPISMGKKWWDLIKEEELGHRECNLLLWVFQLFPHSVIKNYLQ